jgi:hypothetical protein
MPVRELTSAWMDTRATLQRYAQVLTAFPRAAAPADPRWSHVAMDPTGRGFASVSTPLADGTTLDTEIDLVAHAITAKAGDDTITFDLRTGPSPRSIGEGLQNLAASHGSSIDVEADRISEGETQTYDADEASRFLSSAQAAIDAFNRVNDGLEGEIAGPHLWPHGFDIATEWFSPRLVEYDGSSASAQVAMGWYPSDDGYVYVNPWPFEDRFSSIDLPAPAHWYLDGWQGAKLDVDPGDGLAADTIVSVGRTVHEKTATALLGI